MYWDAKSVTPLADYRIYIWSWGLAIAAPSTSSPIWIAA